MRVTSSFGSDTGMDLVDVFLETGQERALDAEGIWKELRPLLAAQGISLADVVDCFLYKQDEEGNWVPSGLLPW